MHAYPFLVEYPMDTEYPFLVTRASEYKKVREILPSTNTSTPVRHQKKLPKKMPSI